MRIQLDKINEFVNIKKKKKPETSNYLASSNFHTLKNYTY